MLSQRSRFVGRDPELALLRAELDAVLAGEGRVVVLAGEAGIGKTRTATWLASAARERGVAVAWGRCHEGDVAPAYWPWTQAIEALASTLDGDAAARLAPLARLLREGGARDASDGGDAVAGLAASGDVPATRARFALLERVTSALLAIARTRPIVLVLDDLHWADLGSLLVLKLVAREVAASPVLVVGTLRDGEPARPEHAAALHDVLRHARTVPLAGLARPAVHELLAERLGGAPDAAVVDQVLAASDGNPFFVLEMGQLLASSGRVGVPAGVAALFERRLAPLPASCRRALDAAALIGLEFALDTLAAVLEEPPADVLDALAPAIALRLVRPVPERLRRHAFAHALLRDALEATLAPRARAELHARIGRVLARAVADVAAAAGGASAAGATDASVRDDLASAAGDLLPRLAHHFVAAADGGGDPRDAASWSCAAGEHALRSLAFEEAARHFARARTAADLVADDALRLRALLGLGSALHGANDAPGADEALRAALALARHADAETFAQTVLRCAAVRAEINVLDAESNAWLEEALALLPETPSALRARLLARLAAGLLLEPGAEARRRALADQATEMARATGDRAALAFVLARRLTALVGPDTLDERRQTLDELARCRGGDGAGALDILTFRLGDLAEAADREGLDRALATFAQRVRVVRDPFHRWTEASARVALALLEGRYDEAETLAAEALRHGQRAQARSALLVYAQQLFLLRGEQARLDEVEPLVRGGASEAAVVPAWRCGLADFYAVAGRVADARRELDALDPPSAWATRDDAAAARADAGTDVTMLDASDGGLAALPRDATWLTSLTLLASAVCRLGDQRRAARLYELLRPHAGRIAVARPLVVFVGLVDDRLGALAALLGRDDAAERHFAHALATAERMRALPWQAHVRHAWAEMLLRRGRADDRARALAMLDDADAIAAALGMRLVARWIATTRAQAGVARATVATAARGATPAEAAPDAGAATAPHATPSGDANDADAPRANGPAPHAARRGTFRREGAVWTLACDGRVTRVRHMVGLAHLARLVAAPSREVHVIDLVAAARRPGAGDASDAGDDRAAVDLGDAGEHLDARARADYAARLRAARDELQEAERANDVGRRARLAAEVELLSRELARGYGLDGRPRRAGAASERARVAVTRAIKYAIDKLGEHDAELAEHFRVAVRTGLFCVYEPPSRDRIDWSL